MVFACALSHAIQDDDKKYQIFDVLGSKSEWVLIPAEDEPAFGDMEVGNITIGQLRDEGMNLLPETSFHGWIDDLSLLSDI